MLIALQYGWEHLQPRKVCDLLHRLCYLFAFVERKLQEYGLALDESAKALLPQTIDELRENLYFDGYKTIKMLCQDIIYEHFSSPNADRTLLSAADLRAFAPGSNYVKKAIKSSKNRIGFTSQEV